MMKTRPRVGLLPLYMKLYDDVLPEVRHEFGDFLETVVAGFEKRGVDTVRADICCVEAEFREAIRRFDQEHIELIVTLHLSYSPSLESIEPLAHAKHPILMLDTTMQHDFGQDVNPEHIMFNHGVHGVQDLASVLRRRGIAFDVVAGHVTESNVLERAAGIARAAHGSHILRRTRALRVGGSFQGMGDFVVPESLMRDVLGIEVDDMTVAELAAEIESVRNDDVECELQDDRNRFVVEADEDTHRRSVRVGLGLRRVIQNGGYTALGMNFMAFDSSDSPTDTMPFLEACKTMARGIGYAGEGDVLTASLVGAMAGAFGRTTFAEIFCPDWRGESLFLSHIGETNPEIAADKPVLREAQLPFRHSKNPVIVTCSPAPGPATLVNLAPAPDDAFRLLIAPVEVLGDTTNAAMKDHIRAWIRPSCPIAEFLEHYSRLGGTHHSALVLGDNSEAIAAFARFAGVEGTIIQSEPSL